jgi:hypothetical protein
MYNLYILDFLVNLFLINHLFPLPRANIINALSRKYTRDRSIHAYDIGPKMYYAHWLKLGTIRNRIAFPAFRLRLNDRAWNVLLHRRDIYSARRWYRLRVRFDDTIIVVVYSSYRPELADFGNVSDRLPRSGSVETSVALKIFTSQNSSISFVLALRVPTLVSLYLRWI